jgi:hypothetical protein
VDNRPLHIDEIGTGPLHGCEQRIAVVCLSRLIDSQPELFHEIPLRKLKIVKQRHGAKNGQDSDLSTLIVTEGSAVHMTRRMMIRVGAILVKHCGGLGTSKDLLCTGDHRASGKTCSMQSESLSPNGC